MKKSIISIDAEINKLLDKRKKLVDKCTHKNVKKTAGSDTGNYCVYDDSYWYDYECPDCGECWREDA